MSVPAIMRDAEDPHYQAVAGPGAVIAVQVLDEYPEGDWREIERSSYETGDFSGAKTSFRDQGPWLVAHAALRDEEHERWHGRFDKIIVRIDFVTTPSDSASFAPVIEKAIATFRAPP